MKKGETESESYIFHLSAWALLTARCPLYVSHWHIVMMMMCKSLIVRGVISVFFSQTGDLIMRYYFEFAWRVTGDGSPHFRYFYVEVFFFFHSLLHCLHCLYQIVLGINNFKSFSFLYKENRYL